jgi:hypothetical protein
MKAVKTQQRYKCDFCKRRGIKRSIERHEKMCYRNPNRFCDLCKNTGKVHVIGDGINDPAYYEDCIFCSRFSKERFDAIEKWKASGEWVEPEEPQQTPF